MWKGNILIQLIRIKFRTIMTFTNLMNNKIVLRISLLIPVVVFIIAIFLKIQYFICDDDLYNWISRGVFTGKPDEHLLAINVCLGYLFKGLNVISSDVNWYGWFFITLIIISTYVLLFILKKYTNVFIALFISVLVELYLLFNYSFTGLAFFVSAIGFIKIIDTLKYNIREKKYLVLLVFSIILFECGFMIRWQSFAISLVIFTPFIIFGAFNNKKLVVRFCLTMAVAALLTTGLFFVNKQSYNNQEWKIWNEFNETRVPLADYVIADYDKNVSNYREIGMSKNDYECIRYDNYNHNYFSDRKFFNNKRTSQIVKMTPNKEHYDYVLLDYINKIGSIKVFWLFVLLEALFFISTKSRKKWFYLTQIAITLLALSCLVFLRRMPERVYNPLILISILLSTYQFIRSREEITSLLRYCFLIFGVVIAMWTFKLVGQNVKQYSLDEHKSKDYNELVSYIDNNPDKLFVFDSLKYGDIFFNKPIITTGNKQVKNALPILDQYTYTPFYFDCIEKFHLFDKERLNLAFVKNDNVYYVDFNNQKHSQGRKKILIKYITEHTHKKIKVKTIKTIKKCRASILKLEYQ